MANFLDREPDVPCLITGRLCPRRCPGRQSTEEVLTTNIGKNLLVNLKTSSPQEAAALYESMVTGTNDEAARDGKKPSELCVNLEPL
jgi:hypothetical protein